MKTLQEQLDNIRSRSINSVEELKAIIDEKMKARNEAYSKYKRLAFETQKAKEAFDILNFEKDEDGMYILGENYIETKLGLL